MAGGKLALKRNFQFTIIAAAFLLTEGCNNPPPSDQQIQQKAAQTTEQVNREHSRRLTRPVLLRPLPKTSSTQSRLA
jgi:hypothetical protein